MTHHTAGHVLAEILMQEHAMARSCFASIRPSPRTRPEKLVMLELEKDSSVGFEVLS